MLEKELETIILPEPPDEIVQEGEFVESWNKLVGTAAPIPRLNGDPLWLTIEDLIGMINNFKSNTLGYSPTVIVGHDRHDGTPSTGEVIDVVIVDNASLEGHFDLFFKCRWNCEGLELLRTKKFIYCSIECEKMPNVGWTITGVGLTNDPAYAYPEKLVASRKSQIKDTTLFGRGYKMKEINLELRATASKLEEQMNKELEGMIELINVDDLVTAILSNEKKRKELAEVLSARSDEFKGLLGETVGGDTGGGDNQEPAPVEPTPAPSGDQAEKKPEDQGNAPPAAQASDKTETSPENERVTASRLSEVFEKEHTALKACGFNIPTGNVAKARQAVIAQASRLKSMGEVAELATKTLIDFAPNMGTDRVTASRMPAIGEGNNPPKGDLLDKYAQQFNPAAFKGV